MANYRYVEGKYSRQDRDSTFLTAHPGRTGQEVEVDLPSQDEPVAEERSAEGSSAEIAAVIERLQDIVAEGVISPRDASLAAGRLGAKALPEAGSDAEELYGLSPRQGRNVARRVSAALVEREGQASQAAIQPPPSPSAPDPVALVGAELSLSPLSERADDGSRALQVLRWQEQGVPIRRTRASEPAASGTARARQHRYRPQLRTRLESVKVNPHWSVGLPFMVLPMTLEPRLLELVPAAQRRRGRPPDLGWVAAQVADLRCAYAERSVSSSDLAKIVLWSFAQYPSSPDRELEADGLSTVAAIARERGGLGAYWLAERIRYLVGSPHIRTITSAHDSIIVLRNNDYWERSRLLLDYTLACLRQGEIPDHHRSWIEQLLLGLAPLFFTGINPIIDAEAARMYARKAWVFPYDHKSSRWLPQTRRAEFEIEYTVAQRRSLASRERFWLNSQTLRSLDLADNAMQCSEEPMYQAQWALLPMQLGIDRRDTAEIISAAQQYLTLADTSP